MGMMMAFIFVVRFFDGALPTIVYTYFWPPYIKLPRHVGNVVWGVASLVVRAGRTTNLGFTAPVATSSSASANPASAKQASVPSANIRFIFLVFSPEGQTIVHYLSPDAIGSRCEAECQSRRDHHHAADHVVPKKRNPGEQERRKDGRLPRQHPQKRACTIHPPEEERQREHAQQRTIEQRAHDIHRFDQRSQMLAEPGERHRVRTPESRRHPGCRQIVVIRSAFPDVPLVNIHHRDRS